MKLKKKGNDNERKSGRPSILLQEFLWKIKKKKLSGIFVFKNLPSFSRGNSAQNLTKKLSKKKKKVPGGVKMEEFQKAQLIKSLNVFRFLPPPPSALSNSASIFFKLLNKL